MVKPRNSTGKFTETKNPKKYLMRLTEEEKQLIEDFRKCKHNYMDMNVVETSSGNKRMIQRCSNCGLTRYLSEIEYKKIYNKEIPSEC